MAAQEHAAPCPVADTQERTPGVWTVGFNLGLWVNQHLMKDVGLVPYMFHKVFGFSPALLGCAEGAFPYLDVLPGMRLETLPADPNAYHEKAIQFLHEHAGEMDLLCLFGPYPFYHSFLGEYRRLRPDGKVYMALDANIHWTDRIHWTQPEFMEMMDRCDVIATSSRRLQRHLNRKWNRWAIHYIPNGFFNPTGREIAVTPDEKEKILLTVGRVGLPEKAHHLLLEAFAKAHEALDGWRLHLVGRIEEGFKPYIEEYFERHPQLRDKVLFKGLVEEKTDLYAEYAKAKVFVLSSVVEGGTPNVVAEALFHGCYMVTSAIDACEDVTNGGACGTVFPVRDIDALAEVLIKICPDDALLRDTFNKTLAYAKNNFDWEVIIRRLYHMLYGTNIWNFSDLAKTAEENAAAV